MQEAVANLAVIGQSWRELTTLDSRGSLASGHAFSDRLSFAAVGFISLGDTASAMRRDSLLASHHPPLDFGYRELARARIAAHLGQYDRATSLLQQSAAEGVRLHLLWGIDFMSDPFLAPLRAYPPFVKLVAHPER